MRAHFLFGLGMAALYYCSGLLCLNLASPETSISPLWGPSGVGVAIVLLFGLSRAAPSILLGSYLITLHYEFSSIDSSLHVFLGLIEAGVAGKLLTKFGKGSFRFKNYQEIAAFFFLGVLLSPLLVYGIEFFILHFNDPEKFSNFRLIFYQFIPANSLGILLFTPLILSISSWRKSFEARTFKTVEAILLLFCLTSAIYFSFNQNRLFLVFPFIIWAAVRFNYLGVSICSLIIALYAIENVNQDSMPLEMLWMQAYIVTCSIIGHLVAMTITAYKKIMVEQQKMEQMLRENQRRLNFAQEVGKMGVFECNFLSSKARWTYQMEYIYGFSKGEFDGQLSSWISIVHPEDLRKVQIGINHSSKTGTDLSIQFRIIRKDGKIRWILCRGGSMKNEAGRVTGFSGINVDITEQKSIEERLRKVEIELLNALQIRDEFFAIASHELKTPLTSLKLQTQLHQRALKSDDPQALSRVKIECLLNRNYQQTERLTRLVDDMLDISRIRTGKLTLKRELCEIGQIVNDIVARCNEQLEASGSGKPEIITNGVSFGNWDPLRIEQVMSNLISNAIRYGLGKPIKIEMLQLEESVRISISDKGIGISPEEKKKVFQRFERGSMTREISGMGLGLFITEQIVKAHEGKIWVESELNEGSTFHLELPTLKYTATFTDSIEQILA